MNHIVAPTPTYIHTWRGGAFVYDRETIPAMGKSMDLPYMRAMNGGNLPVATDELVKF